MSMVLALSALGSLAVTGGIAYAAAYEAPAHPAMADLSRAQAVGLAETHFAHMDVNGDGKLDRADREAAHARMAAEMFDRADTNHDGQISREEWNAGAARIAEMREHHGPPLVPMMRKMGRADADGDRAVSRQEFLAEAAARFDRLDADRNGVVTGAERMQARGPRGEPVEP